MMHDTHRSGSVMGVAAGRVLLLGLVAAALAALPAQGLGIKVWGLDTNQDILPNLLSPPPDEVVDVALGFYHGVAIRTNGTLVSWGSGNPSHPAIANTPTDGPYIDVSAALSDVGSGGFDSCSAAVRADGTLVVWGNPSNPLVLEAPGTDDGPFKAVSLGYAAGVALRTDGSLLTWGDDALTAGTPTANDGPFVAVSTKGLHCVALREDGSLVSWGDDTHAQVSNTPAPEDGPFKAVAAGINHSVALREDGTLVAWGDNQYNQVSDTPDAGAGTFLAMAASYSTNLALRSDHRLVSWGRDVDGLVSDTPTGNLYRAVAGGAFNSAALFYRLVKTDYVLVSTDLLVSSDNLTEPPLGEKYTYQWEILVAPEDSNPILVNATDPVARLTTDTLGSYQLLFTVYDAQGNVISSELIEVIAATSTQYATVKTQAAAALVEALEPAQVTTKGNALALANHLAQTLELLALEDMEEAAEKLKHAIRRTDGCPLRDAVDTKGPGWDWVTDCDAQHELYDLLTEARSALVP